MPANKVPTTTTWSLKKISLLSMRALCTEAGDMSHSHTSSELGSSEETAQADALQSRMWEKQEGLCMLGTVTLLPLCHGQKAFPR